MSDANDVPIVDKSAVRDAEVNAAMLRLAVEIHRLKDWRMVFVVAWVGHLFIAPIFWQIVDEVSR